VQFLRISGEKSIKDPINRAVSLIICLKNESANLQKNYTSWTRQLQENDELILVDDYSSDATLQIARELSMQNERMHVIKAGLDRPGKKQALIDGVAKAKNEIILVTDADCQPPLEWKTRMLSFVAPSTNFVLGYAPFEKKIGFLNLFQRFECVLTAVQYFSYAKAGIPYMGVGRNLLFTRSIFDPEIYKDDLASGDDDLLVSAKADKNNVELSLDPSTFVYSEAPNSWRSYWIQKTRHISSSVKYKSHIKYLLTLFSLSQMLVYIAGIMLLFTPYWQTVVLFFACKILVVAGSVFYSGKVLKEVDLFWYTGLLDLCLALYYLILAFSFPFIKKTKWS
jgi:glycosyltransferase involved in cell wall biosynthesis